MKRWITLAAVAWMLAPLMAKAEIVELSLKWTPYTGVADEIVVWCQRDPEIGGAPVGYSERARVPRTQSQVSFNVTPDPGTIISCYINAYRKSDKALGDPSAVVSIMPIPLPKPAAPTDLTITKGAN